MSRPMEADDYLQLIEICEAKGDNESYLDYLYEEYKRLTGEYPNENNNITR